MTKANVLKELMDSWSSEARENGELDFIRDGLLNNMEFGHWEESKLRITFIAKEPYFRNHGNFGKGGLADQDYCEYDILYLSENKNKFWRNILAWTYGIHHTDKNDYPDYDKASDLKSRELVVKDIPISLVNIKKEAGASYTLSHDLRSYARRYKQYLKKELLEILRPNIVFCCGNYDIVMDEIYDDYDFEQIDDNGFVYYCEDQDILLIAGYNPAARISIDQMYDSVMRAYSDFLEEYNFPKELKTIPHENKRNPWGDK
jgi:hypothetical protein